MVGGVLPKPYRLIDLRNGEEARIRMDHWAEGVLRTDPAPGKPSQDFDTLRVYGTRIDKPDARTYFDITSKMVRAGLVAFLRHMGAPFDRVLTIRAHGVRYRKRYTWGVE